MSYVVTKEFNTVNRRVSVGPIVSADVEDFERWLSRGFIKDESAKVKSAPKTADPIPSSYTTTTTF
jgi:hypothetical protein